MPYNSFGSHSRNFSDLRHFGLYLTTEPPFSATKLVFTGGFESEMAEVQHYLDTIPYDLPAFHIQFLPSKLISSIWKFDILAQVISFCQSLVRWKCLSLVIPFFEAHELDRTVSFDVPSLTALQMAKFTWPKSDRLTERFVQCINESPTEVLYSSPPQSKHRFSLHSYHDMPPLSRFWNVPHFSTTRATADAVAQVGPPPHIHLQTHITSFIRTLIDGCVSPHLISRIPSIRQLIAPLIDLVEIALKSPPRSVPAIPHVNCLILTEPELA
ncbi:hypothetical protein IW262DRAFT_1531531 [Armillaria fumosa]|nr:hypothetical protein IW262DRAFT_1531531 [Armillaria fumosa]